MMAGVVVVMCESNRFWIYHWETVSLFFANTFRNSLSMLQVPSCMNPSCRIT